MTDKTQTHSFEFDSDAFAKLWQEKWNAMLKEKGWPEHLAMPNMGQMPFMMPFMPNFGGFGAPNGDAMQNKIVELERRIAALEKQLSAKTEMVRRTKTASQNTVKKTAAKAPKKPTKKTAKKSTRKG